MAKRFLIVGLGRFGASLARSLASGGGEVMAVDVDMANVDRVKDTVTFAAALDATLPEALRSIGASSCHTAIVSIGENFEAAVLSVSALREVGVRHVVARAASATKARILAAAGAHEVIEVEEEMGRRLAGNLLAGSR